MQVNGACRPLPAIERFLYSPSQLNIHKAAGQLTEPTTIMTAFSTLRVVQQESYELYSTSYSSVRTIAYDAVEGVPDGDLSDYRDTPSSQTIGH